MDLANAPCRSPWSRLQAREPSRREGTSGGAPALMRIAYDQVVPFLAEHHAHDLLWGLRARRAREGPRG